MKYFKWTIWGCMILFLTTSSMALSEETQKKSIARVFDQYIYDEDISPKIEILDQYRSQLSKDEFDKWEKENKIKMLEASIYAGLQKRFLEEMSMNPTEDEIQLFINFSLKQEETRLEEFQSQRHDLLKELQATDLEESKRTSLSEHLKTVDQLIEYELTRQEEEKSIPNYAQIKKNSLKRVATISVTSWKFNKALYEKYGGRIIFQQAGLEPIDAYKQFLDDHTKKKSFEIFDPSFNNIFESMYTYFEMGHNYLDNENTEKYFSKPWWDPTFEPL